MNKIYEVFHDDVECPESLGLFSTREYAQECIDNLEFSYYEDLDLKYWNLYIDDFLINWGTKEEMDKLKDTFDRNEEFFIIERVIQK